MSPVEHQQPSNFFFPALTSYPTLIQPTRYDEKGRQIQYIESVLQRRERLAFLKKREWARRMAMWVDQTTNISPPELPGPAPDVANQYDPDNDTEPYIIYSSSPRNTVVLPPAATTVSTPPPSPPSPRSVPRMAGKNHYHHRRRKSSLSSISELPEED